MKSSEKKIFKELILECIRVGNLTDENIINIKTLILYHAFFYCILESGILHSEEEWFYRTSNVPSETGCNEFTLQNSDTLAEIFQPEIYMKVSGFIATHYQNIPLYYLGGIFYENLLGYSISILNNTEVIINLDETPKKNQGVFYTPQGMAEDFIGGVFKRISSDGNQKWEEQRILDLACGCGIFCLEIMKKINDPVNFGQDKFSKSEETIQIGHLKLSCTIKASTRKKLFFLIHNLWAMDINKEAIEITKFSLLLLALSEEKQLLSLKSFIHICQNLENFYSWDIFSFYSKNDLAISNKFDIVLSNPPYIAYYSRHSKNHNFTESDFKSMKNKLVFASENQSNGRINSIMFFLDFALRVCRPDGYISLIIDMNIHERLFMNLRRWILHNNTLLESRFNLDNFPGVNSGQAILYLKNSVSKQDFWTEVIDIETSNIQKITTNELMKYNAFYIKPKSSVIKKLENFPRLGKYAKISTGVNVGGSASHFFSTENDRGNYFPVISPSMIREHYLLEQNIDQKIYMDFNQLKADEINSSQAQMGKNNIIVLGKIHRFLEPKIFVRQSSLKIIAAFSEEAMICPYSIFVLNQSSEYTLKGILGILNSTLITHFARSTEIIRFGAGKQPQIRKSGLAEIPLPNLEDFLKHRTSLETAVESLLKLNQLDTNPVDIAKHSIYRDIESIVASLYNLDLKDYLI